MAYSSCESLLTDKLKCSEVDSEVHGNLPWGKKRGGWAKAQPVTFNKRRVQGQGALMSPHRKGQVLAKCQGFKTRVHDPTQAGSVLRFSKDLPMCVCFGFSP